MIRKAIGLFIVSLAIVAAKPANAIQLDFYQIDWLSDANPITYLSSDSDWGRVEITLTAGDDPMFYDMTLADGTVGRGGFVSIVTNASGLDDCEVYNLPVFYTDPTELDTRLPQGVEFDFGVAPGTDVPFLNYGYTIDPTPNLIAGPLPTTSASSAVTVQPFNMLIGGDRYRNFGQLAEAGGLASPQAAMDFPAAESGERIGDSVSISIPTSGVAAVNEDNNGCAPGSVARSIQYMAGTNSNVTSPGTAQQVYNGLYGAMKTNQGKKGTYTDDILDGKNAYVSANNLPIMSAQTTSFGAAINNLANGGDVEIGINWGTLPNGKPAGAHRAFVSGVQTMTDANGNVTGYVVQTVDDPVQGDGTAANSSHTYRFDAAGNLIKKDGQPAYANARLINFQIERVHASTIQIEFFGMTFTCLVKPGGYVDLPGGFGTKIPFGHAGEVKTTGGVTIYYPEGATAMNSTLLDSTLAANPEGIPDPTQPTLDMSYEATLSPPEFPADSTFVSGMLNFEHMDMFEDGTPGSIGKILPNADGEYFLQNMWMGDSFFDITYELNIDLESSQVIRLHGEIPESLQEFVWFMGVEAIPLSPPDPDFAVDSFFDVFYDIEISPEAYPYLEEYMLMEMPLELFELSLSAVQLTDLPGDANYDGIVNKLDASTLAANWLLQEGATWEQGDFNGDGTVNELDASLLAANWQESSLPPASVPEPWSLVMIMLGIAAFLMRRQQTSRR